MLLTLASLGVYLPFGLIPIDPEERLDVMPGFQDNRFLLRLEESGYVPWEQTLELTGEDRVELRAELVSVQRATEESPI